MVSEARMIKIDASAFAISHSHLLPILAIQSKQFYIITHICSQAHFSLLKMISLGLSSVLPHLGRERWRLSRCQASVSNHSCRQSSPSPANNPINDPNSHSTNHLLNFHLSPIALDALAQAKRGLRSLFSRGKKKKQPAQLEPTPSSDNAPTQTTTAAAAAAVEVSATSNRSVTEAEHAPPKGVSLVPRVPP